MDNDIVIELAQKTGILGMTGNAALKRFAEYVAAHKQAECAHICKVVSKQMAYGRDGQIAAELCSEIIQGKKCLTQI